MYIEEEHCIHVQYENRVLTFCGCAGRNVKGVRRGIQCTCTCAGID